MSYQMTRRVHNLVLAGDGTTTATVGRLPAQTNGFTVHRVGFQVTVAGTTTPPVVTFSKRVTPAVAGTTITTVTAASATAAAGTVYYVDGLSTKVGVSEELYAAVTTAGGGSLAIDIFAEVSHTPSSLADAVANSLVVAVAS